MPTERRLAAIMFTDIVGYTALMAESEEKGLRVRTKHRARLQTPGSPPLCARGQISKGVEPCTGSVQRLAALGLDPLTADTAVALTGRLLALAALQRPA